MERETERVTERERDKEGGGEREAERDGEGEQCYQEQDDQAGDK
jgi:hypothetical protein